VAKGPGEAAPAGHPVRGVLLEPLRLPWLLYFAVVLLLAHSPRPAPTVMPFAADVVRSARASQRPSDRQHRFMIFMVCHTQRMMIVRWACVVLGVWSVIRSRRRPADGVEHGDRSLQADRAEQRDATCAAVSRGQTAGALSVALSVVSLAVAILSALFTYYQVEFTRDQVVVAQNALQQTITIDDLRFIGRLSVDFSDSEASIEIANFSDFPLIDSLVWTLGVAQEPNGDERLDTVRAPLAGLGACRTVRVSIEALRDSVVLDSSYDYTPEELEEIVAPAAIQEAFLTVQAPSGAWYTISENISYERVEGEPGNAEQAASQTPADQILGDTVAEGVNRSVYFEPTFAIGPRTPISDGAYAVGDAVVAPNGCEGPTSGR